MFRWNERKCFQREANYVSIAFITMPTIDAFINSLTMANLQSGKKVKVNLLGNFKSIPANYTGAGFCMANLRLLREPRPARGGPSIE
jgi:hypothetical protein